MIANFSKHFPENNMTDCGFCSALAMNTKSTPTFRQLYPSLEGEINGQVLVKNKIYTIMADVGPLIQDHLLLLPYYHFYSFAMVPLNLIQIFDSVSLAIKHRLEKDNSDSNIIVFEHGMGHIGDQLVLCGPCSSDHAHMHYVPIPNSKADVIEELTNHLAVSYSLMPIQLKTSSLQELAVTSGRPYIYIASSHSASAYVLIQEKETDQVPSQIMRKLLCPYLNINPDDNLRWHWHDFPFFRNQEALCMVHGTMERWRSTSEFTENWS